MANALNPIIRRNLGFADEGGDILNQQAAQDFRAPEPITNNSIAAMMQPQNYMRIGGRTIDLGPSVQEGTFAGRPAYQTPEGGITAYTPSGERVTMSRGELMANFQQGKQAAEFADLNRRMIEAKVAEQEGKAREAGGVASGKPTFNADAGGYVYPPSAENPQGKFVPVSGFAKEKPSTEGERKAGSLLMRLEGSQRQLSQALGEKPEAAKPGLIASGLRGVGMESLANTIAVGPERQRIEAAQLDMLDAALTLGTGAAYTKEQLQGYQKSYFPQIGDSPATIADKKVRLANIIDAAKLAAGGQAKKVAEEFAQRPMPEQKVSAGIPKTGEVRNGYMFLGGDPSDPNRWKEQ